MSTAQIRLLITGASYKKNKNSGKGWGMIFRTHSFFSKETECYVV